MIWEIIILLEKRLIFQIQKLTVCSKLDTWSMC